MTQPSFRVAGPATTESVMEHMRNALWELLAAEHEIAHADPVARGRLSIPRGMITRFFESYGGDLGPCPWVKDAPEKVGTANRGIV